MQIAVTYLGVLLVMLPLDAVWLGFVALKAYQDVLGDNLLQTPRWGAAALFYALYAGGVVWFAVEPALRTGQWTTALINGALLGLVAYATYDLSNLATLKTFTARLAAMDIAWGAVMTGAAAVGAYALHQAIFGAH